MAMEQVENLNISEDKLSVEDDKYMYLEVFDELITGSYFLDDAEDLLQDVLEWDVVDESFVKVFKEVFTYGNGETLEMLLQSGIDVHLSNKLGYDFIAYVFDNVNMDVVKLLEKRKFNVDACDHDKEYALIKCAKRHSAKDVKFLLDRGANVYLTTGNKEPLKLVYFPWNVECSELFLQCTATHPYFLMNAPLFGFYGEYQLVRRMLIIGSYHVVAEGQGIPWSMKPIPVDYWNKHIKSCREDVAWMKEQKLGKSVTLFTILTEKPERVVNCVRDQATVDRLLSSCKKRHLYPMYYKNLEKRLRVALEMNDLRRVAAKFIAKIIQIFDSTHLVMEKIIGYLNYEDLLAFADLWLTYCNRISSNAMYLKKNN